MHLHFEAGVGAEVPQLAVNIILMRVTGVHIFKCMYAACHFEAGVGAEVPQQAVNTTSIHVNVCIYECIYVRE